MIELDTKIPSEPILNPSQKLLLQLTRNFIALDKLDLKCQNFRCYLGHGSNPELVAREISQLNMNFWPVLPNPQVAQRLNLDKFVYPRSSEEVWKAVTGGVVCLLSGTENYGGSFLRRFEACNVVGIFHWGG